MVNGPRSAPNTLSVFQTPHALRAAAPADLAAERLFALSLDLLCLVGLDGYFKRVNPAFERTLGWTEAELLARPIRDFVHSDDRASTRAMIAQLAAGTAVADIEHRFTCRDGTQRWLSWRTTTADEHGLLYAVGRDVTDVKRADAALRASEGRHTALFEQSPLGMAVIDATGRPVAFNPAFERMWGAGIGAMPTDYTVFDDAQLARAGALPAIRRAFAGERVQLPPLSYDMGALVGTPGRVTWTQVNAYPIHDETGTVAQVVVLHEDITRRVEAEAERRAAEERFRAVQDASLDSFALWDAVRGPDGTVEDFVLAYANAEWGRTFGRAVDEVRGQRLLAFFPTARTSGRFDGYVRVLETGVAAESLVEYEVDGRWFRLSAVRVGESVGITISDFTARMQARRVLQRSREELERLVAERTQALRESEERFRSLTEHASDAISILDADGTLHYGSQAYERVFGYRMEEIVGGSVFDLVHPADREEVLAVIQRLIEHPAEIQTAEFRVVRGDGAETWAQATGQNRLADPAVRGIVINCRDITAQRVAADATRRAEAMFRGLAQQSITGAYIGQDGRVAYGNPRFAEIFGRTVEEVHTLPSLLDLIAPESREQVTSMLAQRLDGGGDVQYSTVGLRKDGTRVPIEVYGSTIELDGRPAVVATVLDISERMRAEVALRESEARFRIAFEEGGTAVSLARPDGGFAKVNPALCALLGYTEAELLTLTFHDVTHPEDRPATARDAQRIVAGELGDGYQAEKRFLTKSGEIVWALLNATMFRDDDGRPLYFVGQMQDISARKHAEAQLRRQSHELQRSNEELERFAYAASHDLQEPLRMVTSFTTLLAEHLEGRLDEEAQQYIDFAVDGAARMRRLIQDLLTYSRVGSRGVTPTEVDVTAILADARRNMHVAIEESGATITHDPLPVIRGDVTQIGQIFQNLLGNALKFRGRVAPAIHVLADDVGDSWHFAIRDNGIGIEPRHVNRLFVMFQRLHTRAEYPGTGIGLALCRRLVERHGGRIWVESAFGKGATFHFTLPKAPPILESAVEPS